jgi:hypothetical protein
MFIPSSVKIGEEIKLLTGGTHTWHHGCKSIALFLVNEGEKKLSPVLN